ncbi:IS701 family transposase [Brasilonema sp. UFV-L1]|uniref:transposase n=1 Tax=Brasilonema sp. UFV-L1 TaxID=2234130 RepID=UPI00145DDB44|nr:IS701 family transposase [Brasilonema sp. UFV-L1]
MESILAHAQGLVYTLLSLIPSQYQRDHLEAMLELFLKAQGYPLPQHSQTKSASALSRFLNIYAWSTRKMIRTTREHVLKDILSECPKGRKPFLQVIIDLTTLDKCGKFKPFKHLITVYNGKRGLHLVVMYLVVGQWRVPWSFRVWRGKGTPSPAQLGLKLVKCLPKKLTKHFKVMILADTAFGSIEFLHGIRKLKYYAIVGVRVDRKLVDGRILRRLHKRGQQVWFVGLKFPVTVSWYYLKRDDGKLEKRFVLSTKPLKASTINRWAKRRWQIEGWFKTAKHRFGLDRFGQGTLLGVYRWLVLSLIAYILAHWAYLSICTENLPDWGEAAQLAFQTLFPQLLLCCFLLDLERIRPLALSHGIDIQISRCKI